MTPRAEEEAKKGQAEVEREILAVIQAQMNIKTK